MTNIFQRIGNNIEKVKKERKKSEDRYWKLPAIERIEYDLKKERIENSHFNFFWFGLKMLFYLIISVLVISLFHKDVLRLFFTREMFRSLEAVLVFLGVIEIIYIFRDTLLINLRTKKLNKRFKLQ